MSWDQKKIDFNARFNTLNQINVTGLVSELNNSVASYIQSGGLAKDASVDPNFNNIQAKINSIKSIKDSYYALLTDINNYLKEKATDSNLSGSLSSNGELMQYIQKLEKKSVL